MNNAVSAAQLGPTQRKERIVKPSFQRVIVRWIHLVLAIPIIGYIYSPFDKIPQYAFPTRYIFVPIMVLSGLWMWKGHLVRRFIWRKAA
jgi:hypothetical protein